ncbi:iron-sulfur cluster biosynthesis family protein [Lacticaseibacillus parakribbianus]|uniref:iron-sulfur cluster biosynthesis family protein n=1 Tax=Lacticaseibacillus parakribbianus TaxID=2970927 RepID=UPI0021CB1EFC|nr:iron-sulfur cluster biosynthesis family protein [Lacticaseibacillus parakribbianus]
MTKITLTQSFVDLMAQKSLLDKTLILIADDGGGKYSLQGGACTIGSKFTLIVVDAPDPDYPVALANDFGVHLWSSDYDLLFLEKGLTLDFVAHQIRLKDNAHGFDDGLRIADGQEVLAAFHRGLTVAGVSC